MKIETPSFSGSTEQRLIAVQDILIRLAEKLNSLELDVAGIEKGRTFEGEDEIILTYSNGSRVAYLLKRNNH